MTRVQIVIAMLGVAVLAVGISIIWKTGPAVAQEAFAGSWDVVTVEPAPWVAPDADKPVPHEGIAQGRITFMTDSVQGPDFLNCDNAKYTVTKVSPEYLFQGGLKDPAREAKELGFKNDEILQLGMSCIADDGDVSMDFDMIDDDNAVFALDNMIYKMTRVKAE